MQLILSPTFLGLKHPPVAVPVPPIDPFPHNFAETIQYLTDIYQGDDGMWYQKDVRGDREGDVKLGKFVHSDGSTNAIDLAVMFNENTDYRLKGNYVNTVGTELQGVRDSAGDRFYLCAIGGGNFYYGMGDEYESFATADTDTHVWEKVGNQLLFDGVVIYDGIILSSVMSTLSIHLLAVVTASGIALPAEFNCEELVIRQDGVEVLNLDFEDYEAGTTGTLTFKDKSGQGNDVTLQGVVDADTIQESVTVKSYANEYGYNEDGTELIQADLNNLGFDILGNPLVNNGRVRYDVELSSGILHFDGLTNNIPLNTYELSFGDIWSLKFSFSSDIDVSILSYHLLSDTTDDSRFYMSVGTSAPRIVTQSNGIVAFEEIIILPNTQYDFDLSCKGDGYITLKANNQSQTVSTSITETLKFDNFGAIRGTATGVPAFQGVLFNLELEEDKIEPTNNAGSEVFNKVTGLPITIQGTIDEDTWQLSPYQRPSNILDGCDVWVKDGEPNKYVGFDLDGNSMQGEGDTDPDGYTWSYKTIGTSIGHNGAETTLINKTSNQMYNVPTAVNGNGIDDEINTGIYPTIDTEVIIYGNFTKYETYNQDHGSLGSDQRLYFGLSGSGDWLVGFGDIRISGVTADLSYHIFKLNRYGFYIDGVMIYDNSSASFIGTSADPFTLFNLNDRVRFSKFNLHRAVINQNGARVFDSATIKSGDTQGTQTATADGMYDSVSDTILYSLGTGLTAYNGLMFDFDGTPRAYNYDDIEFDFNSAHYWFNDVSKLPIKTKSVIYGTQQENRDE